MIRSVWRLDGEFFEQGHRSCTTALLLPVEPEENSIRPGVSFPPKTEEQLVVDTRASVSDLCSLAVGEADHGLYLGDLSELALLTSTDAVSGTTMHDAGSGPAASRWRRAKNRLRR